MELPLTKLEKGWKRKRFLGGKSEGSDFDMSCFLSLRFIYIL
jgi:hypothetical protein